MVNVIYATIDQQRFFSVAYKKGDTIKQVIEKSGILEVFSDIDLTVNKIGIFNQIKKLDDFVLDNDRIEIYRNLIANPKDVRRKRALQQREQGIIK